ncbi:hypothetical protein HYDPIDRAFT_33575 [Hydnomerulius pinastri MD-312]|uniref:Endonuclease/exonuclease/phosphatase domain-containing protein n=1 Tax=Hydnomerulius pinastri MD-312 TaxID=994086 RepID=A0A0C9VZY0_9AGAM|nr:hypothetical protein HYDPIDRAFT_33575 [Hydnomerulius pinastri MD-312]
MLPFLGLLLALSSLASCTTIAEIQGSSFSSPYAGKKVTGVSGIVTAKSPSGFWISSASSTKGAASSGLSVYTTTESVLSQVKVGDSISLGGTITSYRSSKSPNDLFVTQIEDPAGITVHSSSNKVEPVVLGKDRSPPTGQLSALDQGADGFLSVPNNGSLVERSNAALQPDKYGLDFWQSLSGMLVTIPSPVGVDFSDRYGNFWVRGDWSVTGQNSRGGLSMIRGSDGLPTPHPDEIVIGKPLDGSKNPKVAIGTTLSDISGIVQYEYGYFTILPLTASSVKGVPSATVPASTIKSSNDACTVSLGDYNVENMSPTSDHMGAVATHIAKFLNSPDLVFVQEIQDASGDADDGTVDANVTLSNLVAALSNAGSPFKYAFADINPINDQDGGKKGGNIRQAYLYNPSKLSLVGNSPVGGSSDATKVVKDNAGQLSLSYNPGRIDPSNSAWKSSRKPLAAAWKTTSGARFFTVNLQLVAKLDSSSIWGDARPPINAWVDERTKQVEIVSSFVKSILDADPNASIVVGGDCNEFTFTTSVFESLTDQLTEADEAANIAPEERYTYVYEGISQQLDHLFVSKAIVGRKVNVEHVHVNTWASSVDTRASDHDPTVMQMKVC